MHGTKSGEFSVDPAEAARTMRRRARMIESRRRSLEEQARSDVQRIVQMMIEDFSPRRIYQWGSLTRQGVFQVFSDIDLAVEGVTDPEHFFRMLGKCMEMTEFPLDLVQLERINPLHAEEIRANGLLLWEASS
ncbi:nucleotidyltransferase family protein [Desulfonatronum parangueonense]